MSCGISKFRTVCEFVKKGTCSETCMSVLNTAFGYPQENEEHGVMPLAGGIAQQGYQCGLLWGATLAAGAQAYRLFGPGPRAEAAAIRAARRLAEALQARKNSINCLEITDTDWTKTSQMIMNFLKGGPISCMRLTAQFASEAYQVITDAFSEDTDEEPCSPGSCAAMLARKMGATDQQAIMAAGLAGGIGFSGGACGALGAAVWIISMKCADEGLEYSEMNARASRVIERFLESSDYEFECSEIVGREFEDVAEHSRHLQAGGCAAILEALAGDFTPAEELDLAA